MSEIPQSTEPGFKNPELKQILSTKVPELVSSFINTVSDNEPTYPTDEILGDKPMRDRDIVVRELQFLNSFLTEYSEKPKDFSLRSVNYDENSETYRINVGRGPKKFIDKNGEDQIVFLYRKPIVSNDREGDIYSASLSGKSPDSVLDHIVQQKKYSIQINSTHVYLDDSRKLRFEPHTGIILNYSKSRSSVFGVSYIGSKPSYMPLEEESFTRDQFVTLKDFITHPNSQ